jgi:callose synthase
LILRVDFFRLLSFYFGGIGHYLSSVLTIMAIWLMVYLMLGLALFQAEKIGDRPIVPEGFLQVRGSAPLSPQHPRVATALDVPLI